LGAARAVSAVAVADADGYAWLQLVCRSDIALDEHGLAWLALVAVQEGWRLGDHRREIRPPRSCPRASTPPNGSNPPGPPRTPSTAPSPASVTPQRVTRFAALKAREQRDLLLLAGGYRYQEIARLTHSTYTAVNRRIAEGRNRLRRVEGANFPAARLPAV
jgi:hypothetical protein